MSQATQETTTAAETMRDEGPDGFLVRECARWQHAYARARLSWAEHHLREVGVSTESETMTEGTGGAVDELETHHRLLARPDFIPKTTEGALRMLEVAAEILKEREEHTGSTVGSGPVTEILRNVRKGLEQAPSSTLLARHSTERETEVSEAA